MLHDIIEIFCAYIWALNGSVIRSLVIALSYAAPSGSFCGNSLVEKNEECDVGAGHTDRCCDEQCKLKDGALCRWVSSAVLKRTQV